MKFVSLILVTMSPGLVFAADSLETRPKECNYTVSVNGVARSRTYVCNDFDLKFPNTFTNVCVYRNGSWQFGHLKYDKPSKKHKFTAIKVCDSGISVTPQQDTLDVRPPSVGNYIEGKTDLVTMVKNVYTSHVKVAPLEENEAPILCYRKESRGVPVNSVACSRRPNDAQYCEFANLNSKKYVGNWWVQYTLSDKRKPVFCLGGVKISKLDDAANEYAEEQVKVDVKSADIADFKKVLSAAPAIDETPELGYSVAACYGPNASGTKTVRYACKNESSVSFDDWINDEEQLRQELRAKLVASQFLATKIHIDKKLRELKDRLRKEKDSEKRSLISSEIDEMEGAFEKLLDSKVAEYATAHGGKFPVDNTPQAENFCGISWDPANGTIKSAYIFRKIKGAVQRVNCSSVEYYRTRTVSAVSE